MSSWGWGSKFSNLQQVGDFSIFGSKSVTFYFFLFFLWVSKFDVKLGAGVKIFKFIAGRQRYRIFLFPRKRLRSLTHSISEKSVFFFSGNREKKNTVVFFFSQKKITCHSLNFSGRAYIKK